MPGSGIFVEEYGTVLLKQGQPIEAVSRRRGHSTLQIKMKETGNGDCETCGTREMSGAWSKHLGHPRAEPTRYRNCFDSRSFDLIASKRRHFSLKVRRHGDRSIHPLGARRSAHD